MSTISPIIPYRDLRDTDYGSRDYAAEDPEGNAWFFGTYRPLA